MKKKDKIYCAFHNWIKIFKDITIESIVLPIPFNVLKYLLDDGPLILPNDPNIHEAEDDSFGDEDFDSADDILSAVDLDEFTNEIMQSISRLGGKVFPKLNWSSPKDAAWITWNKSLQCIYPRDVFLLLKSSDFISRDLTSPFKNCEDFEDDELDYHLVLRKWIEISPSNEFRCFVKENKLIAISQREISQFHSYIGKDRALILRDLLAFWNESIKDKCPLSSYTFDIFRPRNGDVTLLDFGPYDQSTESLLFTWDELLNEDRDEEEEISQNPEFRYIGEAIGVQPNPYMQYGLPLDVVKLSGEDMSNLTNFIQNKMSLEEDSIGE